MNPYQHLSRRDRRLVARWRAATTAVAVSVVLGLFGLVAVMQPHEAHAAVDVASIATTPAP